MPIKHLCILLFLTLISCTASKHSGENLARVTLVNRNGISETTSSTERLKLFEKTDFRSPQPYKKVQRMFHRNKDGVIKTHLTSYHKNGQLKQALELENNRAKGLYEEFHSNGNRKLLAHILEGEGDLSDDAMPTWIFDEECQAWDSNGNLTANFSYKKGSLEGPSQTFYSNGTLETTSNYHHGLIEGYFSSYSQEGKAIAFFPYQAGERHGKSIYNNSADIEIFDKGKLLTAEYYDKDQHLKASVKGGQGQQATFIEGRLVKLQEVQNGELNGRVEHFDSEGKLTHSFSIDNGLMHGEELVFFPQSTQVQMSIPWEKNNIQGEYKTWYLNGVKESQREVSFNKNNGLYTAWYEDGSVMLIEEYDNNILLKGRYFKAKQSFAVSAVNEGSGVATFFSPQGNYLKRCTYLDGVAQL